MARLLCAVAGVCGPAAWAAQAPDLTALSLESLMELSVVGASKYEQKQSEVAAAVSVITQREIRAFGWRTLADALASLPGVHTTYDHQYTYLGTRGFGLPGDLTTRLLITINGNRVNDPTYDQGPGGREFPLDLGLVDRIEFIPGPGGAVYGQNAMLGVVNVVTRAGEDLGGTELSATTQPAQGLAEGRASWGRRLDSGLDLLMSASSLRARGADRTYDFGASGTSGLAAGLDRETLSQAFLRAARDGWSADLVVGDRRKDDPTAAFFSDPLVPNQFVRDSYALGQVQFGRSMADNTLQLSARLFAGRYRYHSQLSYGGGLQLLPTEGDWRGGELRLLSTALSDHKLMAGLEIQDTPRTLLGALDPSDPANDVRVQGSGYRIGLYGQDEWRIVPSLSATLGLRLDRSKGMNTSASPRAALIWQAAEATTVKVLYGRARRAPNAFERDFDDGKSQIANPALKGERIDTLEWLVDQRVSPTLALRASVYRWTMHDIITLGLDPVSGLTQYQSGPRVEARGLELSADKAWANGTRVRGSVSMQGAAYPAGAGLPNSPRVLAKLAASGPLPWFGLRAGYEWRFDSPRQTMDGSRLGGTAVSSLNLGTDALPAGLEASLRVANLFDRQYEQPGSRTNWQSTLPQDGRSVSATLGCRF